MPNNTGFRLNRIQHTVGFLIICLQLTPQLSSTPLIFNMPKIWNIGTTSFYCCPMIRQAIPRQVTPISLLTPAMSTMASNYDYEAAGRHSTADDSDMGLVIHSKITRHCYGECLQYSQKPAVSNTEICMISLFSCSIRSLTGG